MDYVIPVYRMLSDDQIVGNHCDETTR